MSVKVRRVSKVSIAVNSLVVGMGLWYITSPDPLLFWMGIAYLAIGGHGIYFAFKMIKKWKRLDAEWDAMRKEMAEEDARFLRECKERINP